MCGIITIVYCLRSKTTKNKVCSFKVGRHAVSSRITTTHIDESQVRQIKIYALSLILFYSKGVDLQMVVVTETKTEFLVEVEDSSDEEREKEVNRKGTCTDEHWVMYVLYSRGSDVQIESVEGSDEEREEKVS